MGFWSKRSHVETKADWAPSPGQRVIYTADKDGVNIVAENKYLAKVVWVKYVENERYAQCRIEIEGHTYLPWRTVSAEWLEPTT